MYEQTIDLDRRRRLHRLVLLQLPLGHDRSPSRKHSGRAGIQPPSPGDLRKTQVCRQHVHEVSMLGLVCLAWLYLRKLKLQRGGGPTEACAVASESTSRFTNPPTGEHLEVSGQG